MNRRRFLRVTATAVAGAAAAGASGCAPAARHLSGVPLPLGDGPWSVDGERASELAGLRRLSTGSSLAERRVVARIGLAGWCEEQLAADPADDGALGWRLRRLDTPWRGADELSGREPELVREELAAATLLRRVYGVQPVAEQMVEQWTDHLNISVDKGEVWRLAPTWDREVPRTHALGRFGDLLRASVRAPAMLTYLDNRDSLPEAPNENHARELLELHSLGVNGGYAQADVRALARALTGWTVRDRFRPDRFVFDAAQHDGSAKVMPGLEVAIDPALALGGTGAAEVESVLARLADHPATAQRVALRLTRRFLADDPSTEAPAALTRTEATFRATHGDLRATLRTLVLDGMLPMLEQHGALPPKLKRPSDFVASALRVTGAETDGGGPVQDALAAMGHAPYRWPTPDGPPDVATPWLGGLRGRWSFAADLASGALHGSSIDAAGLARSAEAGDPTSLVDRLGVLILGAPPSPSERAAIVAAWPADADDAEAAAITVAALLSMPAFQWR